MKDIDNSISVRLEICDYQKDTTVALVRSRTLYVVESTATVSSQVQQVLGSASIWTRLIYAGARTVSDELASSGNTTSGYM